MGWKTISGRQYYYTCEREGGKVSTRYFGGGRDAFLISQLEAARRSEGETRREDERAERERDATEERELAGWFDAVQALADEAMEQAGYHKRRGQWRRR